MTERLPPDPPDSEPASLRTRTLPDSHRGPWLEEPDVITMLRIYDSPVEFVLRSNVKRFTLGSSPDCDIVIRDPSISKLHCVLERRGTAIRVTDQSSYNGTFFDGRRETTFDLRPGNTFTIAGTRLLALNDEMRAVYPALSNILGTVDEQTERVSEPTPSEMILIATSGAHVMIVGEPGCDQLQLARMLHAISLRRGRELVELGEVPADRVIQRELIDRASRSTLVVSIDDRTPVMDDAFASSLFSPSYQIRVVVIAPTTSKAAAILGAENLATTRVITLRPLALRAGAIPRMLDRLFTERSESLRVSDMTSENQRALIAYEWPDNLVGLRVAADRLPTISRAESLRKAAAALSIAHSSLHDWFVRVGLSWPVMTPNARVT